jgi:aromatic ring-opening dioxygenase LigB subunit
MPMDWGTLVPLWFFLKTRMKRPRIVIMAPSREILLRENYRFGKLLGQLIRRNRSKRFVFVASADQAHAHKTSGPYGFHPAAAKYDQIVVNAVKSNRLGLLLNLKSRFVENAKPDSLWQIAILAGVTDAIPCVSQLVSYQVPTYYGMICALFNPTG